MRLRILALLTLLCQLLHAQQSVNYFADSFHTGDNNWLISAEVRNNFIYMGGQSFDSGGSRSTPSLVKLDTAGNTIWTYTLNKQIDSFSRAYTHEGYSYFAGGYIYNLTTDSTSIYANLEANEHKLLKVDQKTGDAVWEKTVKDAFVIRNADKDHIIYTYTGDEGYTYEMLDKATGNVVMTKVISPSLEGYREGTISIDTDGTTYISKGDSVSAYTSPMLSSLKWSIKSNAPGTIYVISPNEDGYIYVAGSGLTLFSGRIDKLNGKVGWIVGSPLYNFYFDDYVSDFKVKGRYVYASGQQNTYGSVYTAYRVLKFDRQTGQLKWETKYNPDSPNLAPGAPYAGINSFVVDDSDNVYTSGYEAGDDFKRGTWGICKFDSTGTLIYHQQILNPAGKKGHSRGVFSFELNNHLFHLGDLDNDVWPPDASSSGYSSVNLVAAKKANSLMAYNKKKIRSTYQEFSDVKRIEPFSANKYVVYKNVGDLAVVEMKSAENNAVIWSQSFKRDYYTEADKMCITADNNIYLSILGHPFAEMRFDYSAFADSMYFIKLDSTGRFLKETKYTIAAAQPDFKSLQLYPTLDTNTVFVYKRLSRGNQLISFFNIENATAPLLDASADLNSTYQSSSANQTFLVPLTRGDYAYVENSFFNNSGAYSPLFHQVSFKSNAPGLNKAGYALTRFSIIYEVAQAHYVLPYDSASIIIVGTDDKGNDEVFLYNTYSQSNVWKTASFASNHLDMATVALGYIYSSGRSGNRLLIEKLNASTGAVSWQQTISPANSAQYFTPVEQRFNEQKNQYIISGYIMDTTYTINELTKQLAFYVIIDANGNVVTEWIQPGDYKQLNSLNAIGVTPYGQTIVGGALYKYPYGRSGVLIEADKATVLPVNFISIKATAVQGGKADVDWTIAQEKNVQYYEIQYSTDGRRFETLGTQKPLAGSALSYTYSYVTKALNNGVYYFRIQSTDLNGKIGYSGVAKLVIANDMVAMLITPNPASSQIVLHLPKIIEHTNILIYSEASGVLVKKITGVSGSTFTFNVSALATGVYLIKTKSDNTVFVGKFTKQ